MRLRTGIFAAIAAGAFSAQSVAQEDCRKDAMIVFDASGSMAEMGFNDIDEPRIFDARRAVASAIPEISKLRRLGLLIYGPAGADTCSGLDLRFTPTADAAPKIIQDINAVEPAGETALTEAVRIAVDVLLSSARGGDVVLFTDGKETCGGAPCQLAAELASENVTLHVIGYKVRGKFFAWQDSTENDYQNAETVSRCLADRTGGLYIDTETVEELIAAFYQTLGCRVLF